MGVLPDAVDRSVLGDFIRSQRQLAKLSQRELARLTNLSDPYVSQIERGLHAPSVKVLRALAEALNVRAETILGYAGWLQGESEVDEGHELDVERAILADEHLTPAQRKALIATYHAFRSDRD